MSIQCGPLTESWDLRTGKKPRRASTYTNLRVVEEPLSEEPKAARRKRLEAGSVLKSEEILDEHQLKTCSSIKPRRETDIGITPPRSGRKPQQSFHFLAVVQIVVKYVVGLVTVGAGVIVCWTLEWGSSAPAQPPWNVFSSHHPALPKFEVDYIAASCKPSRPPDCEGIPPMLYQLNADLARTNWAIETFGYRLGDALSSMTDRSSKSGCSYLQHIQSDIGMVRKCGDRARASVATLALEEEAIRSLVTLVGLDVAQDLKALVEEVNTGGSWKDVLDSEAPKRRDRQWRECARCKDALERCVEDLDRGIEILDGKTERYTRLDATLDEIGKQVETTLESAESEGRHLRCDREIVQRIRQSFAQAIARTVNGDSPSLNHPSLLSHGIRDTAMK